jgi:hypothetical protein
MSPAVNAGADPLADLRGYHLPDPVSWWPPAPGWWLLALLMLVLVAAVIHWLARRYRLGAATRAARAEVAALRAAYGRDGDATAFARGLSRLLRRFALARFPRREVAGLTGEDWLAFLDARGGEGRFRGGAGRALAEAPYRPAADLPADPLADLALDWIRRNGGGRP